MNNLPRQKLIEILRREGLSLCDEPLRLRGLLMDFCGQYRKEINVLMAALQERIPADLQSSQTSVPVVVLIPRLIKRLHDEQGLDEQVARWSVESWALALRVISESDLETIDPGKSSPVNSSTTNSNRVDQPAAQPAKPTVDQRQGERPPAVADHYRKENISISPPVASPLSPPAPPSTPTPAGNQQTLRFAGFWIRFVANMIDVIILYIISSIVFFIVVSFLYAVLGEVNEDTQSFAESLGLILGIVIGWLYDALQESSPKQGTLGKQAVGIAVTDMDGKRITFGKASGRHLCKFLSTLILMIGYIMVAFTEKKQALHDILAGTLVVKK